MSYTEGPIIEQTFASKSAVFMALSISSVSIAQGISPFLPTTTIGPADS